MELLEVYSARKERPKSNETSCGDITFTKRSVDGQTLIAVLSDTAKVTGFIVRKLSESLDQALNRLLQDLESGQDLNKSTAKFLDSYNRSLALKTAHATLVLLIIHKETAWYLSYGDSGIAVYQRDRLLYFSPNIADGSRTVQYHMGSGTKSEHHFYDELTGGAFESCPCTAGCRFILFSDGIHGCIRNLSSGNTDPLNQYLQKMNIDMPSDDMRLLGILDSITAVHDGSDDLGLIAVSIDSDSDILRRVAENAADKSFGLYQPMFERILTEAAGAAKNANYLADTVKEDQAVILKKFNHNIISLDNLASQIKILNDSFILEQPDIIPEYQAEKTDYVVYSNDSKKDTPGSDETESLKKKKIQRFRFIGAFILQHWKKAACAFTCILLGVLIAHIMLRLPVNLMNDHIVIAKYDSQNSKIKFTQLACVPVFGFSTELAVTEIDNSNFFESLLSFDVYFELSTFNQWLEENELQIPNFIGQRKSTQTSPDARPAQAKTEAATSAAGSKQKTTTSTQEPETLPEDSPVPKGWGSETEVKEIRTFLQDNYNIDFSDKSNEQCMSVFAQIYLAVSQSDRPLPVLVKDHTFIDGLYGRVLADEIARLIGIKNFNKDNEELVKKHKNFLLNRIYTTIINDYEFMKTKKGLQRGRE